jgi:hypothetical protein
MKNIIKNLRTDLYRVLVQGNADTTQMARVFFVLAIPSLTPLFIFGRFPVY